ncbi:hypothetical protein HS088_TW12G00928 [Tripterygium wilfordii]|uniref:Uncharacterized protein n=1 Tax=Tripterygium wilfordii TaxID=458696 RepID=A0A7J7D0A7_TRIWF|nr:hypothetical protein HS088_TW12G00928 [Tripterygium wilfordii]
MAPTSSFRPGSGFLQPVRLQLSPPSVKRSLLLPPQSIDSTNTTIQTDDSAASSATADSIASLGDDPPAASSGQVIVGVESRYRVVYRLVNGIYVLGITTADHDNSINVFECINIVNQAVSVIVTACRGVDVTPEKLNRKYAEMYMALDIVLRGVSSIRLAAMLASMHGGGIAKMVHSGLDSETKIRGADSWPAMEVHSVEHQASIEAFSNARFELPPETLAAGDEVAVSIAPVVQNEQLEQQQEKQEESIAEKDPFAASEAINKREELVGGFKKNKDNSASDLTVALAALEVTTLSPAAATESTHIGVEGFEGDYGGIEFSNEQASLGETFESLVMHGGGDWMHQSLSVPRKLRNSKALVGLSCYKRGRMVKQQQQLLRLELKALHWRIFW